MKSEKISYIFFLIGYFGLLVTDVCKEINFINIYENYINIICYILIILYILLNLKLYKNVKKVYFFGYIIACLIAVISWYYTNNFTVLRLLLLIAAIYIMNFNKFVKIDLLMKIFLTLLLVILPVLGIMEYNYLLRSDHSIRYAFGFNHPNSLSIYLIMIVFESFYIISVKNSKKIYIIMMTLIVPILIIFIFFCANSRMSALSLTVFYLMNIFKDIIPKRLKEKFIASKKVKILLINLFGIFSLLTVITIIISYKNTDILIKFDKIFSNRYSNYIKFIQIFKISLLGTEVPIKLGYGEYLDNMYLKLLINQGILQYILYYIIFYFSHKKAYYNKSYMYLLIDFVILIEGFTETNMIMPTINIFMLYFTVDNVEKMKNIKIDDKGDDVV